MQNINYHDINYKLKNLEIYLEKIPNSTHFNSFLEHMENFLCTFKVIIDNFTNDIKSLYKNDDNNINQFISKFENFKNNSYIAYIIALRNYSQHHLEKYKSTISKCSQWSSGGYGHIKKLTVVGGRHIEEEMDNTIITRFTIKEPPIFEYTFRGKLTIWTPPQNKSFIEILNNGKNLLNNHIKETYKK